MADKVVLSNSKGTAVRYYHKGGLVPNGSPGKTGSEKSTTQLPFGSKSKTTRIGGVTAIMAQSDVPESNLIFNEELSGDVDGSNITFALSRVPASDTDILLFKNGLLQREGSGNDYTVVGNVIIFNTQNIPPIGAVLLATYRIE